MGEECRLKAANGIVAECDGETCTYWRVVDHLDLDARGNGCAIQHFDLLGEEGSEVSAWLLSVRERLASLETAGDA